MECSQLDDCLMHLDKGNEEELVEEYHVMQ